MEKQKPLTFYWNEFAQERGGCVNNKNHQYIIEIPYRKGKMKFIIYEINPLKVKYEFSFNLGLNFRITTKDWMDRINDIFGKQKVSIGKPHFDDYFYTESSNKDFMTHILDTEIRVFLFKEIENFSKLSLELVSGKSTIELNAPFNEGNISQLERTHNFIVRLVDNISDFYTLLYIQNRNN